MTTKKDQLSPNTPNCFKYVTQGKDATGQSYYMLEVEVQCPNNLELTVDFSKSVNIKIEGRTEMSFTTLIESFQRVTVMKAYLTPGAKIGWSSKFTLKPPSQETSNKKVQEDKDKIEEEFKKEMGFLANQPIDVLPIEDVIKVLAKNNCNYIDMNWGPFDKNIYGENNDEGVANKAPVHWRRAEDFMDLNHKTKNEDIRVFDGAIEPADIKQGSLGNCWFMCSLASLAEFPKLVRRLFITKETNNQGVYRVALCKNGEWYRVTVDDYFPCLPMGGPIFSRSHGNELWVLLLEKAYAKLHGCYYNLRFGNALDGMMDLTGYPGEAHDFDHDETKKKIRDGSLWTMLRDYDDQGYLISASTPGEDTMTEGIKNVPKNTTASTVGAGGTAEGLVPGHAYSVIQVKECEGHKLLNIRNPWGNFEWNGAWSDYSPLWTESMKKTLKFEAGDDGQFWMCWEDFATHFKSVNICKTDNFHEARIKGDFVTREIVNQPGVQSVISNWAYEVKLKKKSKIILGVHQEDIRIAHVADTRPYIDIGSVIMRKEANGSLTLVKNQALTIERQNQLEIDLEPGNYVFLPRTTGCLLRKPANAKTGIPLFNANNAPTDRFLSTIRCIFKKYDTRLDRALEYVEFEAFLNAIGRSLPESEFKRVILGQYNSTKVALTEMGFVDYVLDSYRHEGEAVLWDWLTKLDFDRDFFNTKQRNFIFTIHSMEEIETVIKDAAATDYDSKANMLIVQGEGNEEKGFSKGIRVYCAKYPSSRSYSYGIQNDQTAPIQVTLDLSESTNMYFSTFTPKVTKTIPAGGSEFMLHAIAVPDSESCSIRLKCSWKTC